MVEIAGSHYAHISAAMSETGKVYMWGQCRGQSLTSPMLTKFTCTDDVFSAFSSPLVTWRTYNIGEFMKKIMQNFECVKFVNICSLIIIKVLTVFLIDHVKGFSIIESLSKAFDDPVSNVYTHNIEFYRALFLKTHGQ